MLEVPVLWGYLGVAWTRLRERANVRLLRGGLNSAVLPPRWWVQLWREYSPMAMVEVPPKAAAVRRGRGADTPPLAPRRTRTRRGKIRLVTLDALDARTAAAHSVRRANRHAVQ